MMNYSSAMSQACELLGEHACISIDFDCDEDETYRVGISKNNNFAILGVGPTWEEALESAEKVIIDSATDRLSSAKVVTDFYNSTDEDFDIKE